MTCLELHICRPHICWPTFLWCRDWERTQRVMRKMETDTGKRESELISPRARHMREREWTAEHGEEREEQDQCFLCQKFVLHVRTRFASKRTRRRRWEHFKREGASEKLGASVWDKKIERLREWNKEREIQRERYKEPWDLVGQCSRRTARGEGRY